MSVKPGAGEVILAPLRVGILMAERGLIQPAALDVLTRVTAEALGMPVPEPPTMAPPPAEGVTV